MSDHDNLQAALSAGQELASIDRRVSWLEHPDDPAVKIPVCAVDTSDGAAVAIIAGAIDALDSRLDGPRRRKGTTRLTEQGSFVDFLKRWSGPFSVLYANTAELSLTAVLDDHPAGGDDGVASWRDHRAVYACPRSPEWLAWTGKDGKPFTQSEFGDWVESRLEDLAGGDGYPRPTEVLTMARQLTVLTKGTFQRDFNPTTGDGILINKLETITGSTIIPRAFLLKIRVFEGGDLYEVEARVRFAIADGGPRFSFTLHRRSEIERDAFNDVRKQVADATGLLMLAGAP